MSALTPLWVTIAEEKNLTITDLNCRNLLWTVTEMMTQQLNSAAVPITITRSWMQPATMLSAEIKLQNWRADESHYPLLEDKLESNIWGILSQTLQGSNNRLVKGPKTKSLQV